MHILREEVVAGGLLSYGAHFPDLYRRAADLVNKILRGTKPADIPVEQPTEFDLVVNLETAEALGLIVPHRLTRAFRRGDQIVRAMSLLAMKPSASANYRSAITKPVEVGGDDESHWRPDSVGTATFWLANTSPARARADHDARAGSTVYPIHVGRASDVLVSPKKSVPAAPKVNPQLTPPIDGEDSAGRRRRRAAAARAAHNKPALITSKRICRCRRRRSRPAPATVKAISAARMAVTMHRRSPLDEFTTFAEVPTPSEGHCVARHAQLA